MATAPSMIDVSAATDSGINTDDITSNTTPVITGTGTPGEVITISSDLDGQLVGSVTVAGDNSWTFPIITPLSEGTHQLTVTAADDAAGTNPDSAPAFEVTIDTTVDAPVITGFTDDTQNADIPGTDSDSITSDTTPTVTGTAEADSTIEVFLAFNGGAAVAVPSGDINVTDMANGNWSYEPGTPLAPGDYTITVRATDVAGNVSATSMDLDITIDTDQNAPFNIAISDDNGSSTTDNVTSEQVQTISGEAVAGDVIVISVDGMPITTAAPIIADASGNWSYEHTFPTNTAETGVSHTITATAEDAAGNVSADSAGYTFVLDVTAPNAPSITSISDDTSNAADLGSTGTDGITSDNAITITGTADDNSIIEVSIDGTVIGTTTADGNGDWTFDHTGTTLADGDYTLTATATDLAGNTSVVSGDFDITVDTAADAAPTIDSLSADTGATGDGITSDGSTTISGSFVAGSTVAITIDGNPAPGTVAYSGTTWTYTHNAPFGEGSYDITAQATDSAGNVSDPSDTFTLVVDTTAPVVTIDSISNDTNVTTDFETSEGNLTISGTSEPGSTVTISVAGSIVGTATADATTGAWSHVHDFGTDGTPTDSSFVVSATAVDVAGTPSVAPATQTVEIDNISPVFSSALALDAIATAQSGNAAITHLAAPTLEYTVENGATVEVSYDGGTTYVSLPAGTGANQTLTPPAYATDGQKNVILRATDLAGNVSTSTLAFAVNFAVSDLSLNNTQVVVGSAAGTVVGKISIVDPTENDNYTYTVSNSAFEVDANNNLIVASGSALALTAATYTVNVLIEDAGGNTYNEDFDISVEAQPTVVNNGGTDGEAVTGSFAADNIDAGAGDDTISTGFGEDTVETGEGADVIQDTAENLNGDTFTDFDDEDEIVFTGAQFDAGDLTFTAGTGGAPSTLAIDTDNDGTADTTITLDEALTGGNFLVFRQGSETKVSYEQSLIALGEGTSIAADAANGIVSQSFLTGDGTNTYDVTLDSARSGASAKNLLGVYEVDATGEIVDVRLVFADTSVSTPTFNITGVDAGNKLGFFLVFDGADLVTNAATDVFDFVPANGAAGDANISAGTALDLTINGTVVNNNVFHSFDTTLNGDGVQHAVSGVQADGNGIDIGFEDLFGGGDRDYQDVVISVDIA